MEDSQSGHGERPLWIAVVLRAMADIEQEPLNCQAYAEASAFFTSGGDWGLSRSIIAGHIDLHPDDLERCGRRCIAARRVAEGLPAIVTPKILSRQPLPGLVAIPAPPAPEQPRKPSRAKRDKHWWISHFMAKSAA